MAPMMSLKRRASSDLPSTSGSRSALLEIRLRKYTFEPPFGGRRATFCLACLPVSEIASIAIKNATFVTPARYPQRYSGVYSVRCGEFIEVISQVRQCGLDRASAAGGRNPSVGGGGQRPEPNFYGSGFFMKWNPGCEVPPPEIPHPQ